MDTSLTASRPCGKASFSELLKRPVMWQNVHLFCYLMNWNLVIRLIITIRRFVAVEKPRERELAGSTVAID